jgi:hypothetical protein
MSVQRERRLVTVLLALALGLSLSLALGRGLQLASGARVAAGEFAALSARENSEHLMRGLRELWLLGGWRLCAILLLTLHFPRWLRRETELASGAPAPAGRGLDLVSTWHTLRAWVAPGRGTGARELATAFFAARVLWLVAWSAAHLATLLSLLAPPITLHRSPLVLGIVADAALVHAALLGLLLVQRPPRAARERSLASAR